ncbi:hypothetical protein BT69DRAFT_1301583 [Atractiella rhizophila]|nr:hypothetical protein BT69DRAFT_1301583 [Atractiella rhizophila]
MVPGENEDIPWIAQLEALHITLESCKCWKKMVGAEQAICKACLSIKESKLYLQIQWRAKNVDPSFDLNEAYLMPLQDSILSHLALTFIQQLNKRLRINHFEECHLLAALAPLTYPASVSAQELLWIVFKAIDGSLGLRTYTKHFQLGAMLLRIGGARLVHTFHRANGLPSLHTIHHFVSHNKLHDSYGYPTAHEILHNLGIFPYSDEASANHVFFFLAKDETALEKHCCYNPFIKRCEGLYREHVGDLDLVIDGEEKVFEIGVKLRQGLDNIAGGAHIASFVSVGGMGRFGDKGVLSFRNAFWVLC